MGKERERFLISLISPFFSFLEGEMEKEKEEKSSTSLLQNFFLLPFFFFSGVEGEGREERRIILTHAPSWGATFGIGNIKFKKYISTHAPSWGAMRIRNLPSFISVFQLTHPRGVRLMTLCSKAMSWFILTHATV